MVDYVMTAKVRRYLPVRFVASRDPYFSAPVYSDLVLPDPDFLFARGTIKGLDPDAEYFTAVEVGGRIATAMTGRVRTPKEGPHSFSFGTASCSDTGSNALIYDRIREKAEAGDIEFFIHTGDLHYLDIDTNEEWRFHRGYNLVFNAPRQTAAWSACPMYYMWDSHDFASDRGSRNSVPREAAITAFRKRVPSPPFGSNDPDHGPYYSFVRGRVRFVLTDLRSERVESGTYQTNDPDQEIWFEEQKDWFFGQLLAAKAAGQVIIWASTYPWVAPAADNRDDWGGYDAARQEVVQFITDNSLNNSIAIISGDMHALAYDDGTSTYNYGNLHVMQAAAIDRPASQKGGPYKQGPFPSTGAQEVSQYGIIDVTDTGGASLDLRFRGINVDRDTGAETGLIDETFSLAIA